MRVLGPVALACALLPCSAQTAQASQHGHPEVKALRQARCPAPSHRLPSTPPQDQIEQARDGTFRLGPATVELHTPIDWNQDPSGSINFRNALASLRWVDALALDYRREGNRRSLRQARDYLLDWVRHQPRGGKRTARAAWTSKVVGDRARTLAYLTRASQCAGILRRAQAERLMKSVDQHANWLLNHRVRSNHDLFDSLGLISLGTDFRFLERSEKLRRTAHRRFSTRFRKRVFADEGLWLEQSASYQYLLDILLRRFVTIDPDPGALAALDRKMADVGGLLLEPDGRIAQYGDSNRDGVGPRYGRRSAEQSGLFVLPRSGLAVVKKPASYLALYAGFHHAAHKHSDDLSFELFEHGHRVVSDTGLYDKDPGPVRSFARSAQAHSTLTVDGADFSRDSGDAYGSGIEAGGEDDGWYAVEADNPLLSGVGVGHDRTFLYAPGRALIVIDRVTAAASHTYDRWFQFGPDLAVGAGPGGTLDLQASGFSGSLSTVASAGPEAVSLIRGGPPGPGWTSPSFRSVVPRYAADFSSSASNAWYVTTIALDGSGLAAEPIALDQLTATLELSDDEGPAGSLSVERQGTELMVASEPPARD